MAVLATLLTITAVSCGKTDGTRGGGAYDPTNPVDEFVFTVTPTGVDILQLGDPFVMHPGQNAVYDRTQYVESPDLLITTYDLYKNNKRIGTAYLESDGDGTLAGMVLTMSNMKIENGVKPGMLVSKVLALPGVESKGYYNFMNSCVDIDICYRDAVDMYFNYSDLSTAGRAKYDLIESCAMSDPIIDTVIDFTADDFKASARIYGYFHLGIDFE